VQYLGIDWAYRAQLREDSSGEICTEDVVPADVDGAKVVLILGPDVTACVEMMRGAVVGRGLPDPIV
jgi:hypothetical protein